MIAFFSRHYRQTMIALIAMAVASGIGALIYFLWVRPRKQRKATLEDVDHERIGTVTKNPESRR
jgi:hypothetical protein